MEIRKTDDIIFKRFYYEVEKKIKEQFPDIPLRNYYNNPNSWSGYSKLVVVVREGGFFRTPIHEEICRIEREWIPDVTESERKTQVKCYLEKYNDIVKSVAESEMFNADYYYEDFNGFD